MRRIDQELIREAYVKIGELAARRRIEIGLPSLAFATEIGVPVSTITSFEHGLGADGDDIVSIESGLHWGPGAVDRVVAQVQSGRIRPHLIQMEYLDEDGHSQPIGVFQFPCKWCGETLRVNEGRAEPHECSGDPHTAEEHFAYMMEQIEKFTERPNGMDEQP